MVKKKIDKEKFSKILSEKIKVDYYEKFTNHYLEKVINGDEVRDLENEFGNWLENRLDPNLIFLDEHDYLNASINALKTYGNIAGTDYGSSRQRDKVQMWSDMIRGYLGEIAVKKKIKNDFNINVHLAHEEGKLDEYKDSDIPKIKSQDGSIRENKLKVSIKATKWSGVWLDCPGDQYNHSDAFILVKINTGTEHLMSFLKNLKFFENILLKKGLEKKIIDEDSKNKILNKISDFNKISLFAYIAGYHFRKSDTKIIYEGKKGRKNYEVTAAEGYLLDGFTEQVKKEQSLEENAKVKFVGIGEFTSNNKFIVNTGRLKYSREDWNCLVEKF